MGSPTPKPGSGHRLSAWLGSLETGPAFRLGPLTCVPLVQGGPPPEPLLLCHDALAAGVLEIVEKDGGTVQELLALNHGTQPVLILQGDTLVGARQNRMVAHTVLVRAGGRVVLPVGCIEQGRWSWVSERFQAGVGKPGWRLRADSARNKLERRAEGYGPTLDQCRLWHTIDYELDEARVSTPSRDYNQLMQERQRRTEQQRRTLPPTPNQIGVIVMHGNEFVGLEAFGSPAVWAGMADRVLDSIADAAMGSDPEREAASADAKTWLSTVQQATTATRPALDLGEDVELHGSGFFGEATWAGAHPAHVCLFGSR